MRRFGRLLSTSFQNGVWTSRNPLQRERRDQSREQEVLEYAELHEARVSWHSSHSEHQHEHGESRDPQSHSNRSFESFVPYYGDMASHERFLSATAAMKEAEGPPLAVPPHTQVDMAAWPRGGRTGLILDIDGVVLRGKDSIEGSAEALRLLHAHRIPYVFLTNSGTSEEKKAHELNKVLGLKDTEITKDMVVTSHSPMRHIAPWYSDVPVLVVGSSESTRIAKSYGFLKAVSVEEYSHALPDAVPLLWRDRHQHIISSPSHNPPPQKYGAILVMDDTNEWSRDIQIMLDVLVGVPPSPQQQCPVYMNADDLFFSAAHPLPRLGQGAFRETLCHLFTSVTGKDLQYIPYGKPRAISFSYAMTLLRRMSRKQYNHDPWAMEQFFMVGDNILSDVVGGNANNCTSVFVHSGAGRYLPATRTIRPGDDEGEWLQGVSDVPHYVAPNLLSFVQELLTLPKDVMLVGAPQSSPSTINPAQLKELYNFDVTREMSNIC
eukprot:PhF_6_TR16988/c0_g1_i1/m.25695